MKGILGKKVGMTQLFTQSGALIPVTIIEVKPNVVTKVLSSEKDGYVAIQLAIDEKKKSQVKKPEINRFLQANTTPKRFVKEIRNMSGYNLGDTIDASIFEEGQIVDVTATSKGKGFAGTIKRYNQHIGPKSHGGGGGSQPVRQTGSIGDIMGNRVWPGMTMPGHMGCEKVTIQNLEVIKVDLDKNVLIVKGSVPGAKGAYVTVKSSIKQPNVKKQTELLNLKVALRKNELFEHAKKLGLDIDMKMTINEMQTKIVQKEEELKNEAEAAKVEAKEEKVEGEK